MSVVCKVSPTIKFCCSVLVVLNVVSELLDRGGNFAEWDNQGHLGNFIMIIFEFHFFLKKKLEFHVEILKWLKLDNGIFSGGDRSE